MVDWGAGAGVGAPSMIQPGDHIDGEGISGASEAGDDDGHDAGDAAFEEAGDDDGHDVGDAASDVAGDIAAKKSSIAAAVMRLVFAGAAFLPATSGERTRTEGLGVLGFLLLRRSDVKRV